MTSRCAFLLAFAVALAGCSVKRMAINSLADTLAASGDVFASDDDPDLVRDAVPFSLKTMESLLVEVPNHAGLLLSACSGFTQYSYAFVHTEADIVEARNYQEAERLRERALRMYLRARGYCLRHLELAHPGIGQRLLNDATGALAATKVDEVPALYWTGASWGGAITLALDKPELVADVPVVRAVMDRALALDEAYGRGAIHEVFIALEGVPAAMGGSPERARKHFERAVELSQGLSAGPYVSLATSVSIPAQNRAEFETLLKQALAIDPDKERRLRLANLISQRKARDLLSRIDQLFAN